MPSRNPKSRFNDIIFNIERIMVYLEDYDFERFLDDPRTIDAVERCMQRITEAAIKLQPQAAEFLPGQDWDAMRGFGNVLRHDYDVISERMIWDIAQDYLPGLLRDCQRVVEKLEADSRAGGT